MSDTPPPSSQPTARSLRMWWVLAGIVALTAALYGSVSTFGFVYDDNTLLVHNGRLHSWQGLADAWTSSMWSFDQWKSAGGFYRPITAMVQTTAWMAFGSDAGSWHLLSLMLHLLLVVTTYLLARALCLGRPAALFATAVVGLHPLMIQGATWISALSDPLSAILAYGALIVAVRSWPRVSWPAFVLLALAALTLERAWLLAPLPGLFALLVGPSQPPSSPDTPAVPWPHRWLQATRTGGPYLGAIALAVLLRALLLPATEQAVGPRDFTGLAAKIPGVAWQLLQSAMFPQHLSVAYTDPLPEPLLPLVGLSVVGAVMVWLSRSRPVRLFLCVGFWALLAAVSAGGAFNPGDLVQDRYIYAPMVLLALWAAALFGTSPDADSDQPMSLQRKVGWSAAVGWLLMLTWLHPANLEIWRDEVSLYRRAVLSAPAKPRFLINLSNANKRAGQRDPACRLLIMARDRVAEGAPGGDPVAVNYNLGNCHRDSKRPRPAVAAYAAAFKASRGAYYPALENAALTQMDSGDLTGAQRTTAALTQRFGKRHRSWFLRGIVAARGQHWQGALSALERAAQLRPTHQATQRMLVDIRRQLAAQKQQ